MRRGTTPTIVLTVTDADGQGLDLTGQDVYVTFRERGGAGAALTKREHDEGVEVGYGGDPSAVAVTLTQADTLRFRAGQKVRVQIRCKYFGVAQATDIAEFDAEEILLDGEI